MSSGSSCTPKLFPRTVLAVLVGSLCPDAWHAPAGAECTWSFSYSTQWAVVELFPVIASGLLFVGASGLVIFETCKSGTKSYMTAFRDIGDVLVGGTCCRARVVIWSTPPGSIRAPVKYKCTLVSHTYMVYLYVSFVPTWHFCICICILAIVCFCMSTWWYPL